MVVVAVRLNGVVRTCHLPVMNSKNQPISIDGRRYKDRYGNEQVEKLDSFNVNTAIMRCLTKCLALFGLGLYIYAGEDTAEGDEETKPVVKKEEPKKEPNTKEHKEADLKLFADSMIQFIGIAADEKGLRSYWKANQSTIDILKTKMPDDYQRVLGKFQEAKNAMTKGEGNE